ncbi:Putative aminopeptidase W07G4.4 [Eumeta japonica]|uniref:Aminopeptidase W07G4.4 n=1 Tax=Eumeta variegata TaxID=151549 RepID=A0A4C1WHN5_EUMVA|nr:Putative aminopeptidase W07G4.4 [Eumeta japonica]
MLFPQLRLDENVFIETNLLSSNYDAVVLILYPESQNAEPPRHIRSFVKSLSKVDKSVTKSATLWSCDYVSGGRLVVSPIKEIGPYHDARIIYEASKKGIQRALDAGIRRPLLIVQENVNFSNSQLVAILGALEALYVPLQLREHDPKKIEKVLRLGLHAEEKVTHTFERIIRNAIALESSRVLARDIAGGDPERMTPLKIQDYLKKSFEGHSNIKINVIDDIKSLNKEYPLLAAVSRAANTIERHRARIIELEYKPSDPNRIRETLVLIGKGVTYDTGGADIKISGKMQGMSRDKSGAAAVAGFMKACSVLKPPHLKVYGVLCLCRNSVGEDSYVADELLLSRSGKTIRVVNTDAEGRLAMADSLYKFAEIMTKELDPHIYTIATLTGHAKMSFGNYAVAIDNHCAKAINHSKQLQLSSSRLGEALEISTLRPEDLEINQGKVEGDDLVQLDTEKNERGHQMAAGFLARVSNLDKTNVKYTHLDIAGNAGLLPNQPTAVPILTLCDVHKVFM